MICMGIVGRISRRIFDQQAGCQRSFHLFRPAIIRPSSTGLDRLYKGGSLLDPVEDTSLWVCVASQSGQHFSWAGGIFHLNQYLLQSVPAILQNGHWCKWISREGPIWNGRSGEESLHGSTALLFLLNLDGASWTAGQGRGVEEGCWWVDMIFTFFLYSFMHLHT